MDKVNQIRAAVDGNDLKRAAVLLADHIGGDFIGRYRNVMASFERHKDEKGMTLEKFCNYIAPYFEQTQNSEYAAKSDVYLTAARSLGFDSLKLEEFEEFWPAFKAAFEKSIAAGN